MTEAQMLALLDVLPNTMSPADMVKLFAQLLHSYDMVEEAPALLTAVLRVLAILYSTPDKPMH
jgi:hypothetical protein